jgi:hypothetical protein
VWAVWSAMVLADDCKRPAFKKSRESRSVWVFHTFRIRVHWKEPEIRNRQSRSLEDPSDRFLGTRLRKFYMTYTHNKLNISRGSWQGR